MWSNHLSNIVKNQGLFDTKTLQHVHEGSEIDTEGSAQLRTKVA